MTVSPWRPSRLTRAQQEERRLAAQPALGDPSRTTREMAQHFGVAGFTIRAWRARLRREGEEALRASRATGRPESLTAAQQEEIGAILDGDPRSHGFDSHVWTIPRIRQVIGVKYGVWLDRAPLSETPAVRLFVPTTCGAGRGAHGSRHRHLGSNPGRGVGKKGRWGRHATRADSV